MRRTGQLGQPMTVELLAFEVGTTRTNSRQTTFQESSTRTIYTNPTHPAKSHFRTPFPNLSRADETKRADARVSWPANSLVLEKPLTPHRQKPRTLAMGETHKFRRTFPRARSESKNPVVDCAKPSSQCDSDSIPRQFDSVPRRAESANADGLSR